MSLQKFHKPPLNSQQHIELLTRRCLTVNNPRQVQHYLEYVGYYRLSGYFRYFYQEKTNIDHLFLPGVTFNNVIDIYEFDTSLRSILLRGIEKIEIATRTVISNHMSQEYGAHWYLNRHLFKRSYDYNTLIKQIKQETGYYDQGGKKLIFKHYYNTYNEPELPASWMICEALSFGTWSKMYSYLSRDTDRHEIAKSFNLPYPVFGSWLQAICVMRNLCAHHSMVCYRNFHFIPKKPNAWNANMQKPFLKQSSLYLQIFIINHLLRNIYPENEFISHISNLLNAHPKVSLQQMGFPEKWEQTLYGNVLH